MENEHNDYLTINEGFDVFLRNLRQDGIIPDDGTLTLLRRAYVSGIRHAVLDSEYSLTDLADWFISSVDETQPPRWTDKDLVELHDDFHVIPRNVRGCELPELDVDTRDAFGTLLTERRRQIEEEGWTPAHDQAVNGSRQLAAAAWCYLDADRQLSVDPTGFPSRFPWARDWWKPCAPSGEAKGIRREIVKGGGLILAEIDRLAHIGCIRSYADESLAVLVRRYAGKSFVGPAKSNCIVAQYAAMHCLEEYLRLPEIPAMAPDSELTEEECAALKNLIWAAVFAVRALAAFDRNPENR